MRIAQVAPLMESVPPRGGGGTERAVSYLTEELAALGHDVTLFASGDSTTSARLEPACARAIRLPPSCLEPAAPHLWMLEQVARRAAEFDVIHFHTGWLHMPLFSRLDVPFLTTLHGSLDNVESRAALGAFGHTPLVAVSDAQRASAPAARWLATVPHGLPRHGLAWDALACGAAPAGGDLVFLGRMAPQTRPEAAIRIARAAGRRIRIAAVIDGAHEAYVRDVLMPALRSPHVEFVGEIADARKAEFLGGAAALLVPAEWSEPCGLAMVEAAACGTPVIALPHGAVAEIVEHGVTGFVVRDEAEAAAAVGRLGQLSRPDVRARFEQRFTSRQMAERYLRLYAGLQGETAVSPFVAASARDRVLHRPTR